MFRFTSHLLSVSLILVVLKFSVASAVCVSGFVIDASGNPVAKVDLDFIVAATGVKLAFPTGFNDNTSDLGAYSICVLPGVYIITFDPPDSTHYLGSRVFNVDLTDNQDIILPNIVLGTGVAVSGVVRDSRGAAVGAVDIDVDSLGGGRVFTPNDDTKLTTGAYWIVVPPGKFRVRYDPPPVSGRLRGYKIDSISITRDTIINVTLSDGALLNGIVTDRTGNGIFGVDIDLREDSTGKKIYVSNNETDSTGFYNVAVPAGIFDLRFAPPSGSRFVAELIDSFEITTDASYNQVLDAGLICSVFVHDSTGNPIAGADLDFKQESTGIKLFTPNDNTNSNGYVVTALFPDIYTIQIQPPIGTIFDELVTHGVSITSDTTFDFLLPEVQRINWSGRIVNSLGQGVAEVGIDLRFRATGTKVFIRNNFTDSAGNFDVQAPIGIYDVLITPPRQSRYVAAVIENSSFHQDTLWQDISIELGFILTVSVYDNLGIPLVNADLDVISEASGHKLFAPFDNSDVFGMVQIALHAGVYTIRVDPPPGISLLRTTVSGFNFVGDTSLTFVLSNTTATDDINIILEQSFPNPFNSQTTIRYFLLTDDDVSLRIYNILGQRVKLLYEGFRRVGTYSVPWDGTDQNGNTVSSGVYFYEVRTNMGKKSRSMVYVR